MQSETQIPMEPPTLPDRTALPSNGTEDSGRDYDLSFPPDDLPETDGEPLESHWHVNEINLLCDVINCRHQGREDYYCGGNMFIYFSRQQVRNLDYRGPDFFFVAGRVSHAPMRKYWATWDEGGRYPDVIIELLSPTTRSEDLTTKKDLYERVFNTRDYFCYDPETRELLGWRLLGTYQALTPNERGWLWSEELGLWLGIWHGSYLEYDLPWLRFFDNDGRIVPTYSESAEKLAIAEKQRADALAEELAMLKANRQ